MYLSEGGITFPTALTMSVDFPLLLKWLLTAQRTFFLFLLHPLMDQETLDVPYGG